MEEIKADDIYKRTFKRFKLNDADCRAAEVIDFASCDLHPNVIQLEASQATRHHHLPDCLTREHFRPYEEWKMYTLKEETAVPGLIVIPSILKSQYRPNWFTYFHDDLPKRDDLNLKANIALKANESTEIDNLTWISFGYHHDWNSKIYSLDQPAVTIPERVLDLSHIVSTFLNINFQPQAGIVNYYTRKRSLCFHTDHSELDLSTPLLSLSLGAPALFLIGGLSKDSAVPITPIKLRDSDLLIMSDKSRLALHAVPRILPDDDDDPSSKGATQKAKHHQRDKSTIHRINVNVRQVMRVDSN